MHASIWNIRALQNSQFQNSKLKSIGWGISRWNNNSGHESPGHANVLLAYVLLTNVLAFNKDTGIIGTGPSDHYLSYFVFNTKLWCAPRRYLKNFDQKVFFCDLNTVPFLVVYTFDNSDVYWCWEQL